MDPNYLSVDAPAYGPGSTAAYGGAIDGSRICDGVCHSPNPESPYPNTTGCLSLSCHPGLEGWQKLGYSCFMGSLDYPPSAVTNCYCKQQYFAGLGQLAPEDEALCTSFFDVLNNANFYQAVSIISVLVINGISKPVIKTCVALEKQSSVSSEKTALVSKMFSLQFMNTALITLIVNTAYSGSVSLGPLEMVGVGTGDYSNFNMAWYMTIGASLVSTMGAQIFTPHIPSIQNAFVMKPLGRLLGKGSASTQAQLDELYEGFPFEIEVRAAFIGVNLMVSIMYSAGLPLLNLFAFVNFLLSYAIDKLMLIKYYAQPPMYGPSVPRVLANLLPLGTFIHMAIGLYMLANKSIMYGPDLFAGASEESAEATEDEEFLNLVIPKLVRFHTLVLFLIFAGYSVLFVFFMLGALDDFMAGVASLRSKLYFFLCGCLPSARRVKHEDAAKLLDHAEPERPAFCSPFRARMTRAQQKTWDDTGKLSRTDKRLGFRLAVADGSWITKIHTKDGEVNGQLRKKGQVKMTWEHIRDTTSYTYDIGLNRLYRTALMGIKANKLPNPSRKNRIEEDGAEDLYSQSLYGIAEEIAEAEGMIDALPPDEEDEPPTEEEAAAEAAEEAEAAAAHAAEEAAAAEEDAALAAVEAGAKAEADAAVAAEVVAAAEVSAAEAGTAAPAEAAATEGPAAAVPAEAQPQSSAATTEATAEVADKASAAAGADEATAAASVAAGEASAAVATEAEQAAGHVVEVDEAAEEL